MPRLVRLPSIPIILEPWNVRLLFSGADIIQQQQEQQQENCVLISLGWSFNDIGHSLVTHRLE